MEFLGEILFVEAPNPNLPCPWNFSVKFSLLGPRTPTCLPVEFLGEILFVGTEPQLALSVEFQHVLRLYGGEVFDIWQVYFLMVCLYIKKT